MSLLLITFALSLIAKVYSDLTSCDLCRCYKLQLAGLPITFHEEICYTYLIHSGSDEPYCDPISSLTIDTNDGCGMGPEYIDYVLIDYAPKCYDIDAYHERGIHLMHSMETSHQAEDYAVFSLCFRAEEVAGFNQNGKIEYETMSGLQFQCDTPYLPNFCGTDSCATPMTPQPTTPAPTTPWPTTPAPTTPAPTTSEPTPRPTPRPTTPAPVTSEPTSSQPTTAAPTTADPTSSAPSTSNPTTSEPTSSSPTTSNPTTSDPTSAAPTTSNPTTSEPTTSWPTTDEPTTASPTTADPTTSPPTTVEPTEQPTQSPTFTVCDSTDPYNIAFLLDESGSISETEWDIIINFIKRIIDFDVQDDSYVSLYEFASLPGFQKFLNFTGPKESEQGVMLNAAESMRNRYTKAGQTETWDAVNRVLDDFYELTVDPDHLAVGNILFLVTDGNPTDEAGDATARRTYISDDYNTCPYIENRLKTQFPDNFIDVVLIIIDPDATVDTSKIECLDYYNNQEDIIPIVTFDSTAFHQIEERIRNKICTQGEGGGFNEGPAMGPWVYPDGEIGLGPVPIADDGGVECSNDPGSANPCDDTADLPAITTKVVPLR